MLTPIDIQNHTLKTSMSGYNKKDTEEFLASILDSYETLFRENRTLKEKITSLSEGIQYYKQMENTLQKALILAEKTSTETQEAAKEQADSVIKDAQAKADSIIRDIKAEADSTKAGAEAAVKEAEAKAAQVIKDAELKAESVTKEAEAKAESLIREAEAKAALTASEAQKQVSGIKEQAQNELDGIRISAIKLVQDYENYCHQVKKLAKAQLGLLENDEYKLHVTELNIDDSVTIDDNINGINTDETNKSEVNNAGTNDNGINTDGINKNEVNDAATGTGGEDTGNPQDVQEESQKDGQDNLYSENNGTDSTGTASTEIEKEEKFSWNSDESEYAASKEPDNANPFTFIDPE